MTRKMRETEEHLKVERTLAEKLEVEWSATLQKIPRWYKLDFAVMRDDNIAAFVELKHRTNKKGTFWEYMISLDKVQAAKRLHEDTGKPCLLVVEWQDTTEMIDLAHCKFRVGFGGTKKRDDDDDMEPMAYIKVGCFDASLKYRAPNLP